MTKRYSTQFKQEALNFVQNHPSLSVHTVAKQLGVGYSTLDNWMRLHRNSKIFFGSSAVPKISRCC